MALLGMVPAQAGSGILRFNALSPEQETAMGVREFEKIKREKPVVGSGPEYQAVQRVAARLIPVVPVAGAQWEFVVFRDSSPNAFALPGGKVGVHTGLFQVVQNDAQLAAVLGHELAHVTARHSGQRITQGVAGAAVGVLAGKILENKTGMDERTAQAITGSAATLRLLKFSRSQELEADQLGTNYMARAGYDPAEAVTLWTRFAAYKARNGGGGPPAFLSTHPVDSRRIEELQAHLPVAKTHYRPGSGTGASAAVPTGNASAADSVPPKARPVPGPGPGPATPPDRPRSLRDLFRRRSRTD
jgi:predicted Zn-dependent protease